MRIAVLAIFAAFMSLGSAHATTQIVRANIAFDTPLSLSSVRDIAFGTVKAEQAGTHIVSTSGLIRGDGVWLYGAPAAGRLTVAGSSTQAMTISTGTYVQHNGVTPSTATCQYGSAPAAPCDSGLSVAAPGAGTELLLGIQVDTDATPRPGSMAMPSFTVTAVYN